MDLVHHAMPARSAGKMQKILSHRAQAAKESAIGVILGRGIDGPVNHNRTAHNSASVHKAPIAAVPTTIAIIAHHKIIIRRNDELAALDVTQNLFRPFRAKSDFDEVAVGRRKIIAEGIFESRFVNHVWLRQRIAIYIDMLVDDPNAISGQTDHALYVVRMIVEWKLEDDNIAAANCAVRKKLFVPSSVSFEYELIHQQMISDQHRRLHGLGRNFETLNDEGGSEKRKQNGYQKRFGIFGKSTASRQRLCTRRYGSRDVCRLRGRSICFHELLQAVPLLASRISSAVLAAPCSASFLLRPSDADSFLPASQTSTSNVFWCSGPDSLRMRYSTGGNPRCWSHSCKADLWSARSRPPALIASAGSSRVRCKKEAAASRPSASNLFLSRPPVFSSPGPSRKCMPSLSCFAAEWMEEALTSRARPLESFPESQSGKVRQSFSLATRPRTRSPKNSRRSLSVSFEF